MIDLHSVDFVQAADLSFLWMKEVHLENTLKSHSQPLIHSVPWQLANHALIYPQERHTQVPPHSFDPSCRHACTQPFIHSTIHPSVLLFLLCPCLFVCRLFVHSTDDMLVEVYDVLNMNIYICLFINIYIYVHIHICRLGCVKYMLFAGVSVAIGGVQRCGPAGSSCPECATHGGRS